MYVIENTLGVQNPVSVLKQFDISPMEMILIINTIHPKIKNFSIKNRLTRQYKALIDCNTAKDPSLLQ